MGKKEYITETVFFVHAIHLDGVAVVLWFLQVSMIDMLPKLIAGHLWIWKSYMGLFQNILGLKSSRKRQKILMKQNEKIYTLGDIVKTINDSLKNKQIIRLDDKI